MKRLTFKVLPIEEEGLGQEPIILERDGQAVAAIIPIADYEAFCAWRERQEREPRWRENYEAFERERQAYDRLEKSLLKKYRGLYVAIRGGQVVDSDADEITLVQRVYERLGYGPMYVRQVGAPLPTRRILSPKVVRR